MFGVINYMIALQLLDRFLLLIDHLATLYSPETLLVFLSVLLEFFFLKVLISIFCRHVLGWLVELGVRMSKGRC